MRDGRRFDGRVVTLLPDASDDPDLLCSACVGSDAGKHIIGLTILRLADEHGNFVGTVLDPEDGTLYRCVVTAVPAHDSLELRAYVGVPLFGRTVMWKRAP